MCGILGIFGKENCFPDIVTALNIIQPRGKDGVGLYDGKSIQYAKTSNKLKNSDSNSILAHNLHSVVNLVNQPIKKQGILSSNCEIYNWNEIKELHNLSSNNDSEIILDLIEKKGIGNLKEILNELDGVYSFAYWDKKQGKLYLARDIIGVKPLWFSTLPNFAFCSEKKALEKLNYQEIQELNPRTILVYNTKTKKIKKIKRGFFKIGKLKKSSSVIQNKTEELILKAIEKRLPKGKFGLLFSGGIDSTFLAYAFKKLNREFICYTSALEEKGMEEAPDLISAKKVAKELNLKLKVKKLNLAQTQEYIKKITPLIEDNNVVKVGVALTFFTACELAKKDNIKVIFSGLGSEEIFAGYERHKKSHNINKECLSGLIKIYERDLYRDDVITMFNNLELRLPFLDKKLIEYALKIPAEQKLDKDRNKIILRDIAKKLGIPEEFAERKKKAAQYGSKFDRALLKLAKREGKKKSEYLQRFYHPPNVKLGVLWSGGKDSAYAAYTMLKQNYEISCLISLKSKNPDSYMFHTPTIDLVHLQAEAMELPIIIQETKGEKEVELKDLEIAIKKAKKDYKIEGIVTGALFSNYQRERVEKICDKLELKIFSPLWHIDQTKYMYELLDNKFRIIVSSIAADGLSEKWLGRMIDSKSVKELEEINMKIGINVAFEGGEAETFVINCPMFKKQIKINKTEKEIENTFTGRINILDAELQ